ncbi:hypothetical protein WNZ15_22370 [Roseibium sp. AS2]|uniref:hypothetical protein n=1 Tax=Roseibium sp. AS2 TaxID=3135781 RepID=UPI00316C030E
MQRQPTAEERKLYPHLTQRDDWPPEDYFPAEDMTKVERTELKSYWQERWQDAEQATEQHVESNEFRHWWSNQQAVTEEPNRAQQEREEIAERIISRSSGRDAPHVEELQYETPSVREHELQAQTLRHEHELAVTHQRREKELYQRATSQWFRTNAEQEFLEAAKFQSPAAYEYAQDIVIAERMAKLRAEDQEKRVAALERQIRKNERDNEKRANRELFQKLEALRKQRELESAPERDLPQPGPNHDSYSREELDTAQDRMNAEYEYLRPEEGPRQLEQDRLFLEELREREKEQER